MKGPFRRRRPSRTAFLLACLLILPALLACERKRPQEQTGQRDDRRADSVAPMTPAKPLRTSPQPPSGAFDRAPGQRNAASKTPVILVLGDSIAAGAGITLEESFPSVLQNRLREAGFPHRVVNGGVSGDTTAGGLARLDWIFRQRIDWMIIELGGNDGLRGQSISAMKANLSAIIEKTKARGIPVILAGMQMPANYGADYTRRFRDVFSELAKQHRIALIPFLLEGVAMRPRLNRPDGIHPNAEGARLVAENVWKVLRPLLRK